MSGTVLHCDGVPDDLDLVLAELEKFFFWSQKVLGFNFHSGFKHTIDLFDVNVEERGGIKSLWMELLLEVESVQSHVVVQGVRTSRVLTGHIKRLGVDLTAHFNVIESLMNNLFTDFSALILHLI